MDPARFDAFSKRLANRRLFRRQAFRLLGAAGVAAGALALGREHAAADCRDITICFHPCPGVLGLNEACYWDLPGGPQGACWSWDSLTCNPCATTWDELNARCQQSSLCPAGQSCRAYWAL